MHALRIKSGDVLIISLVAVLAALAFLLTVPKGTPGEATAVVYRDNQEIKRFTLHQSGISETFENDAPQAFLIEVEQDRIRFESSSCSDQVCVQTGWLQRPGQVAACVPYGILIRLEGESPDELDVMLR